MILARLALVTGLSCAALIAFPVKADVMEINADGARWVTGGSTALPAAPIELISADEDFLKAGLRALSCGEAAVAFFL